MHKEYQIFQRVTSAKGKNRSRYEAIRSVEWKVWWFQCKQDNHSLGSVAGCVKSCRASLCGGQEQSEFSGEGGPQRCCQGDGEEGCRSPQPHRATEL